MEPQNGVNAGLECLHFLNSLSFAGSDQSFNTFAENSLNRDPFGEKLGIQYSEDVLGPLTVNAGIFKLQSYSWWLNSVEHSIPIK